MSKKSLRNPAILFPFLLLSGFYSRTQMRKGASALGGFKSGLDQTWHNRELWLARELPCRFSSNGRAERNIFEVGTLPVPPPCSSEQQSFNTAKWASLHTKQGPFCGSIERVCKMFQQHVIKQRKKKNFLHVLIVITSCKLLEKMLDSLLWGRGHISLAAKRTKMAATRPWKTPTVM